MLLNEITLRNFRQFKGEHLTSNFLSILKKMLTVIMGKNGSGQQYLIPYISYLVYFLSR